jgi:TPR repeat protein
LGGVAQDIAEAVRLFRIAADQGLAGAQCDMGNICLISEKVLRRTEQKPSDGTASPPRRVMQTLKPAWRNWARSCDAARSAAGELRRQHARLHK